MSFVHLTSIMTTNNKELTTRQMKQMTTDFKKRIRESKPPATMSLNEIRTMMDPIALLLNEGSITKERFLSYFNSGEVDIIDIFDRLLARAMIEKEATTKKTITDKEAEELLQNDENDEEEDFIQINRVKVKSKDTGRTMIDFRFHAIADSNRRTAVVDDLVENYW